MQRRLNHPNAMLLPADNVWVHKLRLKQDIRRGERYGITVVWNVQLLFADIVPVVLRGIAVECGTLIEITNAVGIRIWIVILFIGRFSYPPLPVQKFPGDIGIRLDIRGMPGDHLLSVEARRRLEIQMHLREISGKILEGSVRVVIRASEFVKISKVSVDIFRTSQPISNGALAIAQRLI